MTVSAENQQQQEITKEDVEAKKKLCTKELATRELETRPPPASAGAITVSSRGVSLSNIDDMFRFSQAIWQSGLVPQGYKNEQAVLVAIEMGMEFGMAPMAAIRGIAVINGMPALWGGALLGVVQSSGKLDWIEEKIIGEGDDRVAVCRSKRLDSDRVVETRFSVEDAKVARLWKGMGKQKPEKSPWFLFPERMLGFRARGFNLNDNFSDVLSGCITAEEAMDIHEDRQSFDPEKAAGSKADALADELAPRIDPNRRAEVVAEQDGDVTVNLPPLNAGESFKIHNKSEGTVVVNGPTQEIVERGETITIAPAQVECRVCAGGGKTYSPNSGKLIGECWECEGTGQVDPNETRTEREARYALEDKDVAERDEEFDPATPQEREMIDEVYAKKAAASSDPTTVGNTDKTPDGTSEKTSTSSADDAVAAADEASGIEPNVITDGEDESAGIRYKKLLVRFANNSDITIEEAEPLVQEWLNSLSYSRGDLLDDLRWVNVWAAAKKIKPVEA